MKTNTELEIQKQKILFHLNKKLLALLDEKDTAGAAVSIAYLSGVSLSTARKLLVYKQSVNISSLSKMCRALEHVLVLGARPKTEIGQYHHGRWYVLFEQDNAFDTARFINRIIKLKYRDWPVGDYWMQSARLDEIVEFKKAGCDISKANLRCLLSGKREARLETLMAVLDAFGLQLGMTVQPLRKNG
jgi:hypothetical protein